MEKFVDIIHQQGHENWSERNREAFNELFGASIGRYPEKAKKLISLRANDFKNDSGVPFSALIHPSNPDSGAYGGMSFVIFPVVDAPCIIAMVVGTQGLNPDEMILARPGHARKVQAICKWLNKKFGNGSILAWAKQDPVRTDIDIPDSIKKLFPTYKSIFERYGKEIYAIYAPNDDKVITRNVLKAFLDLAFEERGQGVLASANEDSKEIRSEYFAHLMPNITEDRVSNLLCERRFVVVQGPPGTGKTRMALRILENEYKSNGFSIQFHPNITYENFVGGLAPIDSNEGMGFKFAPKEGFLMKAAREAINNPEQFYLLHIDEINRADLSKVLGEAIFLLESEAEERRELYLPYDFGEPFKNKLQLPKNLHILGTMNSADRSIAILDVAVQRRFAFVKLWPQIDIVKKIAGEFMNKAFEDLVTIFLEYADDDTFALIPGHSYFLETDDKRALQKLKTNLVPLLEEYIAQGYVAGFTNPIRAYLQWIEGM